MVGPGGQVVWVWDNAHDIVAALMVEASVGLRFGAEILHGWSVCASVGDLAITLQPASSSEAEELLALLSRVRTLIASRGEFTRADLTDWSVLDGLNVSDGHLRTDLRAADCLLDVVSAFEALVRGDLDEPPDSGDRPIVGAPGVRAVIRAPVQAPGPEERARRRAEPFHFIVRDAFVITGRGTVAIGFITSGVVHTGDELEFLHGDTRRIIRCRGVETVNRKPYRNPPDLGLVISDVEPADITAGDVLRTPAPE